MKQIFLSIIVFLFIISGVSAQEQVKPSTEDTREFFFGFGFGLDYGGIGTKYEFVPIKYIGIVGSLGYNLQSVGYNIGASFKILPDKKVTPTLNMFYGYNAVLLIKDATAYNAESYNATSYGVTFGLGMDIRTKWGHKWSINLLLPIRSDKFMATYHEVEENPRIQIDQALMPVAFSIGYNIKMK